MATAISRRKSAVSRKKTAFSAFFFYTKNRSSFRCFIDIILDTHVIKMVKDMNWFRKKKKKPLHFEDTARFNWALDTNQELQDGMARLAQEFPNLTEERYTQKILELFRSAGLELSVEDLKMLLALRRETDSMLLRKERKDEERR